VGTSNRKSRIDPQNLFGDSDALTLHQYRLKEWMVTSGRKRSDEETVEIPPTTVEQIPSVWKLIGGITPHPWQTECLAIWRKKGRGTVKVVTGAGKTLEALLLAETLQNEEDKELRVAIVVPTIVLMLQWHDELLQHGNLPGTAIGRLGGGYDDDFRDGRRILICVLASASQRLAKLVKDADVDQHLLLIADECHRAGAAEMSKVFKTKRRWVLGLSATPEREDDDDAGYNKSLLGKQVGPIIYEFTLADAIAADLVPKFTINHYGLTMGVDERRAYEALSRSITDAMSQLKAQRDGGSDGDFFAWARTVASRGQGELALTAKRFIANFAKRRELLNHLEARHDAVIELVEREFRHNPEARVILFHESIAAVMDVFADLCDHGLPVIAEHSDLAGSVRESGLDLFRRGIARIIVSARSLIEGFNVPAVDVGIIVASSGSVRQRIQSLGRVLRRHRGPTGEEKTSCVHVLYASDSSDENIYAKVHWDELTGVDRNRFYRWDLPSEPLLQDGPPRNPLPSETQIEPGSLQPGSQYPGEYEGAELTCDSQQNVSNAEGNYAKDTADLAKAVIAVKGSAGRFRVTPKRRYVLVRMPVGDEWETRFVTRLSTPLRFQVGKQAAVPLAEVSAWGSTARPGDRYPFPAVPVADGQVRYKQKLGGSISKKVRGGELFARRADKAENARKGEDAARLVAAIKELSQRGQRISRIEINDARHVLFREAGQLFFIYALDEGLEFPQEYQAEEQSP